MEIIAIVFNIIINIVIIIIIIIIIIKDNYISWKKTLS